MTKRALITGITGQDDYVIATGRTHSVGELVELAFRHVGLNAKDHVAVDERFYRPAEVTLLQGNAKKAQDKLGWTPFVGFEELVAMMVDADIENLQKGRFR